MSYEKNIALLYLTPLRSHIEAQYHHSFVDNPFVDVNWHHVKKKKKDSFSNNYIYFHWSEHMQNQNMLIVLV